jgi:hypothetical protein
MVKWIHTIFRSAVSIFADVPDKRNLVDVSAVSLDLLSRKGLEGCGNRSADCGKPSEHPAKCVQPHKNIYKDRK